MALAWGTNPFTNYSTQPAAWGQQSPWQNAGQFNPGAMNFGQQGMGGTFGSTPWMQGWGGGTGGMFSGGSMMGGPGATPFQTPPWMQPGGMGQTGPNGAGMPRNDQFGMPPWMQSVYGSMRNAMQAPLGGMPGSPAGGIGYGQPMQTKPYAMPPGLSTDPTANNYGGNVGTAASDPFAQTAQPGAPSSPNGIYSNVVHNGTFDGSGVDWMNSPQFAGARLMMGIK